MQNSCIHRVVSPICARFFAFWPPSRSRGARNPENLDRAAEYIADAFRRSGGRVEMQAFDARRRTYRNVIAHFGPDHGAMLVVGAHYDAFCETGDLPGADDNASGTAGLLELARLLGDHPPRVPVALVAYSTEEPPFFGSDQMGSAVHAESIAAQSVASTWRASPGQTRNQKLETRKLR